MYLITLGALMLLLVLLKTVAPRDTSDELSPTKWGYLRARRRGAVSTALVSLYLHRAVKAGRPGTVRRDGVLQDTEDPVERAVYTTLTQPMGPRTIETRRPVRVAVAANRTTARAATPPSAARRLTQRHSPSTRPAAASSSRVDATATRTGRRVSMVRGPIGWVSVV